MISPFTNPRRALVSDFAPSGRAERRRLRAHEAKVSGVPQSAQPSHAYPIIRLPRKFRRLAGSAATIYETTHNGALAFLAIPHRNRRCGLQSDLDADNEGTSLYLAKVGHSNRLEPICF